MKYFLNFKGNAGRRNTIGGPHAARVLKTPNLVY